MNPALARRIVPWSRIAFGSVCVLAPDAALKSFLIKPQNNADGQVLINVFGSRAFVIGALSAGLAGPEGSRVALRAGAVMDAVDITSMARAYRAGRMSTGAFAYNAVIGVAFSALGFIGASAE